jgi:hypothetical protein
MSNPNYLNYLADLCKKMLRLDVEINRAEEAVKELKAQRRELNEIAIPDIFLDMGLSEIKLEDEHGLGIKKVSVSKAYSASIPKDRWDEAKQWLVEQEEDAMIKTKVTADFGKGRAETENSIKLMTFLKNGNVWYDVKESVHPMTLKSFVKQRLEGGKALPMDLFGVHVINQTKIK